MNIKEYINRINYKEDIAPSFDVLKELQRTHLLNVPFENLDIHYNNPIELDIDKIYHKVVVNKRGGFCYELNGLFQSLLNMIGFDSKIISARVYDNKKEKFGEEYDHLAIIVKLNQNEYLIDVGFGEFAFHPLKLKTNEIQTDPRGNFIIEKYKGNYYKISKEDNGEKSIEYIFTEKERAIREFREMCHFHQTSPNSHFTQKKLISKPTESGRITLSGNSLKITESGITKESKDFNEDEYGKHLLKWFDIEEYCEHYLPLLYALALKEEVQLFNDKAVGGSLTMTSLKIA